MLGPMDQDDIQPIDPATLDLARLRLPPDAHKGLRGSVGILGGAAGMVGAAWLAGRAALHAGAGRVYVGQLDPSAPVVDPLYPELMLQPAATLLAGWEPAAVPDTPAGPARLPLTALVVGPGMGEAPPAADLLAQALQSPLPLLLDADALNLLARRADLAERLRCRADGLEGEAAAVITPHPAEAARLLHQSVEAVQADRPAAARALAQRYHAVVVLKGAGTLVAWRGPGPAGYAGAREAVARNPTGSVRLATAGTGDVLSGLIGALLARGLPAPVAARLGVWVHGRAGERMPVTHPTAGSLLPPMSAILAEFSDVGAGLSSG